MHASALAQQPSHGDLEHRLGPAGRLDPVRMMSLVEQGALGGHDALDMIERLLAVLARATQPIVGRVRQRQALHEVVEYLEYVAADERLLFAQRRVHARVPGQSGSQTLRLARMREQAEQALEYRLDVHVTRRRRRRRRG